MKIVSWNVNGIRAITKKDFFSDVNDMNPDILCLQETKAQDDQVAEALKSLEGYYIASNSAEKKGYSGVAILSRTAPLAISRGMGLDEHDSEGRILCAEYEKYFVVSVYVPNSGSELKRLSYRQEWDKAFFSYLKRLEEQKPVIVCGDFNVAHRDIDLARPKANYNKYAGYMQEEIDGMDRFAEGGLVDSFRHLYPERTDAYSWWSYRAGARGKNIGWRIDYFLLSQSLLNELKNAEILSDVMGSDHCPVAIEI
ncbi:exodeoxyribonuclease III [Roseimarinus sediminis]|jgi:exodeoxyribonuclease-3|uniref:exodeoxyribonuclease III n=1 Tax=Roseimarinus sediminis TaxID=1610899 RepID=UPI003D1B6376